MRRIEKTIDKSARNRIMTAGLLSFQRGRKPCLIEVDVQRAVFNIGKGEGALITQSGFDIAHRIDVHIEITGPAAFS